MILAAGARFAGMILACGGTPSTMAPADGTWSLRGSTDGGGRVVGQLQVQGGEPTLSLWSDTFGTGPEPVSTRAPYGESDLTWWPFSLQIGLGSADAELALSPASERAILPLGAREGEATVVLAVTRGPLPAQERDTARDHSAKAVAALQAAWQEGSFLLQEGDGSPMGKVIFDRGEARVEFFDATMLTDGPVPALQHQEGPDLVLEFQVEPSFHDETGQIRVNVPTSRVVMPTDVRPSASDRWLKLVPGTLDPEALQDLRAQAIRSSIQRERAVLDRVGPPLATALTEGQEGGTCPPFERVPAPMQRLLVGYSVKVEPRAPRPGTTGERLTCDVVLEPVQVQHGRRIRARVGPERVLSHEVLEDAP